ncbi:hypothetical protein F443_03335 [Phytophthora nicotianae P1569]|uniref:NADP-dependent oxidoreductase domain-containing protein n=1 Tax=Phytophthora nicotianae P1569 TaxID=1317065 RepID=V9FSN3_PHYNI|nr:hypothetical protein F443_03335 [Phytophthora nicotianae P1569]
MMKTAFKHGVNFFDTSEMYANGHAEKLQGGAVNKGIIQGVWSREDLVLTTKIFLGSKGIETAGPNDQGLSRKHIIEGTKASLRRMELDYVDVLFCHRPDPHTPIEELRPSQLEENLKALEFVDKITPEVKAQIDDIVNFVPTAATMDTFAYVRERHL